MGVVIGIVVFLVILLALVAAIVAYGVNTYNDLVKSKNSVDNSFAQIDA